MSPSIVDGGRRHVVIVLKRGLVPDRVGGAYPYGGVQHALQAARVLAAGGTRVGFLLYERAEELAQPSLELGMVLQTFSAVTLYFNFQMDSGRLVEAVRRAADLVAYGHAGADRRGAPPLLYFQSSALLPFAPPELDVLVTHHAPFVAHVVETLGFAATAKAFGWDQSKTEHLGRMQARVVEIIATRENVQCVEISMLQYAFLLGRGVPFRRLRRLPQPLEAADGARGRSDPLSALDAPDGLVAITAVSRLDYFKNVECFIEGCALAVRRGHLCRAVVIGGAADDPERRRLEATLPRDVSDAFVFMPRLPRSYLISEVFQRLADRGVFVCTSRFDLVPYTALEAARAGLCTVVPDNGSVGAAEYLPQEYRFSPSPEGLANLLGQLAKDSRLLSRFAGTSAEIRHATSDTAFAGAFDALCEGLPSGDGRGRGGRHSTPAPAGALGHAHDEA